MSGVEKTYVVDGVTREQLEKAIRATGAVQDEALRVVVAAAWVSLCLDAMGRQEEYRRIEEQARVEAYEGETRTLGEIGHRHLSRLEALLARLEATTAERPIPSRCDTRLPHVPHGWFRGEDVKFQCPGVPS